MLLERCIAAVQGPVAQNVVPAAFHLGNISRAMYEDDIDERSETIDHYEKLGHHGIAYVLQLQLANADWYPGQASRLIDYRKMFLKEWVSSCSHVDILEEMDLLLKCDISKSQLFIPKALLMVPSILEGIRNDGRGDCLGRSVSMIQHDAGICTSWPVDMLHKKDETGRSAAHIACYTEDSKLFQQILAFSLSTCVGEDIFWLDLSPLHIAATRGYTEAFRLMQQMTSRDIFQKALKQKGPETARTCLHWAASCGHLDTVIFICRSLSTLEVGDTYDNRGRSALHLAARHGHVAVVDFLCHRMNEEAVDVRDKNGCTSLWYAAAGNHPLAMESLAYFAKVNRKDKHGYTPLAIAAAQGHTVAVYHLLICSVWDGELDINTLNEDLNTPLDLATDGGHEACMKLLVDHGAVRNQDCDGMVPETRI
ncbi:Nn.00g028880.m01.CDS01 [Neocucurbitaria sp. VM-36]